MELRKPESLLIWLQILRLYRQSFPSAERKPFWVIARMYQQKKCDVWYWREKGQFAGFVTTVNGGQQILLDYFAAAKDFRGKGLGTRALAQLQQIYGDKGLFVEIEGLDPAAPNALQREKRKQFYLRCGMTELFVRAEVFGVEMELLGSCCTMTFEQYRAFYRDYNSSWAAEHIKPIKDV
jgi:GNAT superfamily N-acetyltransferase